MVRLAVYLCRTGFTAHLYGIVAERGTAGTVLCNREHTLFNGIKRGIGYFDFIHNLGCAFVKGFRHIIGYYFAYKACAVVRAAV